MKFCTKLLTVILILTCSVTLAQKSKSASKSKELKDRVKLESYSYPYYAIINNGPSPITGCFIYYKNKSYFVTTRHNFFTTTNERKKITNVMIFIDQNHMKSNSKVLSLNMNDQKVLPVCFEFGCTDIVLLPVEIPADMSVNYVGLESKDVSAETEMAIVGYVKDSVNIIETKFNSFLPRDSAYFLTDKSSAKDLSGSPVLVYSKSKTGTKVILAGIYSGKEISQENFDKGLISRGSLILRFLNSKTKEELSSNKQ
ncbi:MAG: hypothetical protein JST81_07345 [Bacteroidetes bacterium]|nr:hypothetical protein [Bacteroidota bacterium]